METEEHNTYRSVGKLLSRRNISTGIIYVNHSFGGTSYDQPGTDPSHHDNGD